jgi:hypothetical protein
MVSISVFIPNLQKNFGVIIFLYIDVMLIFSTNMIGIIKTKRYLTYIFKMKNLGKVDTILYIKIKNMVVVMHLINHIILKRCLISLRISI